MWKTENICSWTTVLEINDLRAKNCPVTYLGLTGENGEKNTKLCLDSCVGQNRKKMVTGRPIALINISLYIHKEFYAFGNLRLAILGQVEHEGR